MPTTIFIALQCCQCSTMQVKQQKKSSNKWSCVVCNQKQSVRKVYAQGFMAKDVRKFVQSFNMSRQLADQNQFLEDEQNENLGIQDDRLLVPDRKNKRTDWSEYIDPPEEDNEIESSRDEFEPKIVTEMPKALFKRQKLKNYSTKVNNSVDEEFVTGMVTEMPKPVFRKPKLKNCSVTVNTNANQVLESGRWFRNRLTEAKELQPTHGTSKWKSFSTQEGNEKFEQKVVSWRNQSSTTKSFSKWSSYITEETDDLLPAKGKGKEIHADPLEINELNDQKVEDDIHPDFNFP